jgi:glutaredoxin
MSKIRVYGADWCSATRQVLGYLDDLGVPYEYLDIDKDQDASAWVKQRNGGRELKPTIDLDGEILSEPSKTTLDESLRRHGLLKAKS